MCERITVDTPQTERYGHELRYRLAAGYLEPGDRVLDAACGSGYGEPILNRHGDIGWVGVDRDCSHVPARLARIETDLCMPCELPWCDVFVGFETIEHLADYRTYIALARHARRCIIVSTPVVRTTHTNPYHLHDFVPGDLQQLFENDDWACVQTVGQPSEVAEICVLTRR